MKFFRFFFPRSTKDWARNVLVLTLLVCAFFLPVVTVSTSKFGKNDSENRIDIVTTTRNNWESITIPNDMQINATLFQYKEMKINNQTGCIDRKNYTKEFLRLFNINPYSMELDLDYVLIVGSNTELGSSIKKLLKSQHKQYIELSGIIDFDPAPLMEILSNFSSKITKAIICTQPTQHRYTSKGFVSYNERQTVKTIKSYCEAFVQHRIPFIIAHHPPYSSSLIDIAEFFESPIVLVPFLTEFEEFRNYEHPIFRSAMECSLTGKTEIDKYENYPVSSIKLSEIVVNENDKNGLIVK